MTCAISLQVKVLIASSEEISELSNFFPLYSDIRFEKQHVVLSSDEISLGVDDTSFPNAMRIMAENKTKLLTSTEALRSWVIFIKR